MKETNMEHFRSEIEGRKFDFALINGNITWCTGTPCQKCDFNIQCVKNKIKWLMSEYKPEPVLTQKERHFVEFIETGWLARDRDGNVDWHKEKPNKKNGCWRNNGRYLHIDYQLHNSFRFITWEDEEPYSVEELRKLKVE